MLSIHEVSGYSGPSIGPSDRDDIGVELGRKIELIVFADDKGRFGIILAKGREGDKAKRLATEIDVHELTKIAALFLWCKYLN